MKGIAHTVLLLLGWSTVTRWLLGIGLALTVSGVLGLQAAWPARAVLTIMAIIGVITAVISPVVIGGTVFRGLSAPRVLRFIPHGRLKLLLAAIGAQLLLTAFIAGVITLLATLAASTGIHLSLFVQVFALLTLQCIGSFVAARVRAGGLALADELGSVGATFRCGLQVRAPAGISGFAGGIERHRGYRLAGLAGVRHRVFAGRARSWCRVRNSGSGLPGARAGALPARVAISADTRFTFAQAIPILLSGMPRERRAVILRGLTAGLAVAVISVVFNALRGHWNPGSLLIVALCLFAGPAAGSWAGVMTQGAKALWFHAGLSRAEVFAQLEIRSWRVLLGAFALCVTSWPQCWFAAGTGSVPAASWKASVLVTPLVSGPLFLYAQLQYVRGRRLDLLLLAAAMGLWAVEFITVMGQGAPARIAALIGAQVLLVALLRELARRRWDRIDWLVHKGARQFWGLN